MKQRFSLKNFFLYILVFINNSIGVHGYDITIMTYNVMQTATHIGKWGEEIRAAYLTDAILNQIPKESRPDVIVFTDASSAIFKYVLRALENEYPYRTLTVGNDCSEQGWDSMAGSCLDTPLAQSGGTIILSRYVIASIHGYIFETRLSKTSDGVINRGAIYAQLKVGKSMFHLVGTHLQSSKTNGSEEEHVARLQQLKEIDEWLKEFSIPKSEAVVVAGDFNEELSNTEYINDIKEAIQADFKIKKDSPLASYSSPTNSLAKASALFLNFSEVYEEMLDYIMVKRNHLAPTKYLGMQVVLLKSTTKLKWKFMHKTFYPVDSDNEYEDGYHYDLSDHYPVVSTFTF